MVLVLLFNWSTDRRTAVECFIELCLRGVACVARLVPIQLRSTEPYSFVVGTLAVELPRIGESIVVRGSVAVAG